MGGWVGGIVGLIKNNASSAQLGLEVGAWAELGNIFRMLLIKCLFNILQILENDPSNKKSSGK